MQSITTIGLDIAKSVFQVHGVDAGGQVVVRRQLKRRYGLTANSTILQTGTDNFPTEGIHRQSFLGWVETLLGLHSRASTCVRNNRIRPFHPPHVYPVQCPSELKDHAPWQIMSIGNSMDGRPNFTSAIRR
jgi:hypothetical protein